MDAIVGVSQVDPVARVFIMREVMELETDEICKELTINANNLWVILYRARMALRLCLEQNWFARTST
jgi:RNA polymerase sigma-70 factor (ECF subfamily)